MGRLDPILEFFGLKSVKVVVPARSQSSDPEEPTVGAGQASPRGARGEARPSPPPSQARPPAPSREEARDAEIRRERERRAEQERAERERLDRPDPGRPVAADSRSEAERDPTTGGLRGAPPRDEVAGGEVTVNVNLTGLRAGRAPTGVLIAIGGENAGKVFALSEGGNVIGRHWPGTEIAVPLTDRESFMSREHCEIECKDGRFTIKPCTTSSGELAKTLLDDRKLEDKRVLRDGRTIKIFDNELRFRTVDAET